MDSIIKALSNLLKNIRFRFKSSCCDCKSDCNQPVEQNVIEIKKITYV